MKLDNALEFAVILAWQDMMKVTTTRSARVEYQCEPGTPLENLNVWSVRADGQQDLVCHYGTNTSLAYPSGVCFKNGYYSEQLAQNLDFVMKNQDQFTRRADACRDGLVLIYPPTADECREAAAWMQGAHGTVADSDDASEESELLSMRPIANRIPRSETSSPWTDA